MTHLVTENCIKCKHTDCVDVCPWLVDCFYEGPNFLVINPDECIDCAVCVVECPVDAIQPEEDVEKKDFWMEVNTRLSKKWPNITKKKDPLADAAEWKDKPNKIDLLEE